MIISKDVMITEEDGEKFKREIMWLCPGYRWSFQMIKSVNVTPMELLR